MVVRVKNYSINIPYKKMKKYTNYFCEENHVGDFEFGKFYRGDLPPYSYYPPHVTVKIWDVSKTDTNHRDSVLRRLMNELLLLQNDFILSHPTMPQLCDYCIEEEHIGVIYMFEPVDTVYNLLHKDEFSWLQRMKVAAGIAHLLSFFHDQEKYITHTPFLVHNLNASHIVLDKKGNPKLCDFSMITGGFFPCMEGCLCLSVNEGSTHLTCDSHGELTANTDVYAFGVLLLNLMTKRVYTDEEMRSIVPSYHEWTQEEQKINEVDMGLKEPKLSLLSKSLEEDPCFYKSDGHELEKLAIQCMEYHWGDRPTMKEVVNCLQKLEIVKRHSDMLPSGHLDS